MWTSAAVVKPMGTNLRASAYKTISKQTRQGLSQEVTHDDFCSLDVGDSLDGDYFLHWGIGKRLDSIEPRLLQLLHIARIDAELLQAYTSYRLANREFFDDRVVAILLFHDSRGTCLFSNTLALSHSYACNTKG